MTTIIFLTIFSIFIAGLLFCEWEAGSSDFLDFMAKPHGISRKYYESDKKYRRRIVRALVVNYADYAKSFSC